MSDPRRPGKSATNVIRKIAEGANKAPIVPAKSISVGGSAFEPPQNENEAYHPDLSGLNDGANKDGGHTFLIPITQQIVDPTNLDDTYKIGTVWVNTVSEEVFVCVDNSSGAAVWSSITAAASGSGYDTIQEDGTSLTQRAILNFIGSGVTASDNAGNSRTNVTLHDTLNALADYNTNGLLTQVAASTFVGRVITGTLGKIVVTNGDGVSGNPTINIGAHVFDKNTDDTDDLTEGVTNLFYTKTRNFTDLLAILGPLGIVTLDIDPGVQTIDIFAPDMNSQVWSLTGGAEADTEKFLVRKEHSAIGAGYGNTTTKNTFSLDNGTVTDAYSRLNSRIRVNNGIPVDTLRIIYFDTFLKRQNGCVASVTARWGTAPTSTTPINNLELFIIDENNTANRASVNILSAISTSWQTFTTGMVDISSWSDRLRWGIWLHGAQTGPMGLIDTGIFTLDIELVEVGWIV